MGREEEEEEEEERALRMGSLEGPFRPRTPPLHGELACPSDSVKQLLTTPGPKIALSVVDFAKLRRAAVTMIMDHVGAKKPYVHAHSYVICVLAR